MGFPDLPPPSTTSLKRCRSEDPSSLAELCSPLPKQAFSSGSPHHLSILEDLESSLNSAPAQAPTTSEDLVTEMMHSLQKVMSGADALIAGSEELQPHPSARSTFCIGESIAIPLGECDLVEPALPTDLFNTVASRPSGRISLSRDMAGNDTCLLASDMSSCGTAEGNANCLNEYRDMTASDCDVASALEPTAGYVVHEGGFHEMEARTAHRAEQSVRDGHNGMDNIQHLLDLSDDDLSLIDGASGVPVTEVTEQTGGQWSLLDEFPGEFAITATSYIGDKLDWLEGGCDLPPFNLSQIEEEGLLSECRVNAELLVLDCSL